MNDYEEQPRRVLSERDLERMEGKKYRPPGALTAGQKMRMGINLSLAIIIFIAALGSGHPWVFIIGLIILIFGGVDVTKSYRR